MTATEPVAQEIAIHPATADDAPAPRRLSLSVVIPARNEAATIGRVVSGVLAHVPDAEVIVVDDASTDATADLAEAAGARVVRRPYNIGNGAAVKTGIRQARGDVIVVLDADGQHNPADIPRLLGSIGPYDMVVGTRSREGQQNAFRWLGNSLLNSLASYVAGVRILDLTSGFRAMRRPVIAQYVDLLPNSMSWPTTSLLVFVKAGYNVRFEPITMYRREAGRSSQTLIKNFFKFLMIIFKIVSLFAPLRIYTPVALALFALGVLSFLVSYFVTDPGRFRVPNSASALFVGSVVVFMFGLLSEQIASLWFQGQHRDE
jgi:glycosyltransferase involved in cell wall biosynthesis